MFHALGFNDVGWRAIGKAGIGKSSRERHKLCIELLELGLCLATFLIDVDHSGESDMKSRSAGEKNRRSAFTIIARLDGAPRDTRNELRFL